MRLASKTSLIVAVLGNIAFGTGLIIASKLAYDHSVAMSKMSYNMAGHSHAAGCMEAVRILKGVKGVMDPEMADMCNKLTDVYLEPISYMKED